jgi:hypothetical protein
MAEAPGAAATSKPPGTGMVACPLSYPERFYAALAFVNECVARCSVHRAPSLTLSPCLDRQPA